MSTTVQLACPSCEKTLKVPPAVFGKKIKCKDCGHAFVVEDPEGKSKAKPNKPGKPGAKQPAESPPPPPPESKKSVFLDDDEDTRKIEVIEEHETARCPHCAKELDPPDAVVCLNCGFNNVTRSMAETKKVWEPDAMDWFSHLLPGIIAALIVIGLIVFHIISITSMREWLTDTFLEMDETDAAGKKRFYVAPGAFIFFLIAVSLPIIIPAVRFAFKRLAIEYKPPEQVKK